MRSLMIDSDIIEQKNIRRYKNFLLHSILFISKVKNEELTSTDST